MPGHNFILLALRGNLLDLRGIKRQFLQLTSDAFSYFSLICIACVFLFSCLVSFFLVLLFFMVCGLADIIFCGPIKCGTVY